MDRGVLANFIFPFAVALIALVGRYQLVWSGKGGRLYKLTENFELPGETKLLTDLSAPRALGGGKVVSQ